MALFEIRVRSLKAWSRPRWTLSPLFVAFWPLARWSLLGAGLILLSRASLGLAVAVAVLLTTLAAYLRVVRSDFVARRLLTRQFLSAARDLAGPDLGQALRRELTARHPEWGGDLIERMVSDHPAPDSLARIVIRMERQS
jgi:hypothetical protein